jgi:hypothetical protein
MQAQVARTARKTVKPDSVLDEKVGDVKGG